MYEKNKGKSFTLRLSDEQFQFLVRASNEVHMSVSNYTRMLIDFGRVSYDNYLRGEKERRGGFESDNENSKTDRDNHV